MLKRLAVVLALAAGCHHETPPDPAKAEAVGMKAPAGQLTGVDNKQVAMTDVLGAHDETVVVFYRGFY
jgi:hypothetical protein